jgi:hypothetical protein
VAELIGHARHDPLDVAAATDRGAALPTILRMCGRCLDLYADLTALASAVPSAAIPRRSRDFTLTAADAARLRSNGWRRLLDAFGSARDEVSRPLALGFATLGVAGLLLTAAPSILPMAGAGGSAAASDAPRVVFEQSTASGAPAVLNPAPVDGAAPMTDAPEAPALGGPNPMLLVSGAFLGAGGAILVARALVSARRRVR